MEIFYMLAFIFDPASFLKAQLSNRVWERSYLSVTPPEVYLSTGEF